MAAGRRLPGEYSVECPHCGRECWFDLECDGFIMTCMEPEDGGCGREFSVDVSYRPVFTVSAMYQEDGQAGGAHG